MNESWIGMDGLLSDLNRSCCGPFGPMFNVNCAQDASLESLNIAALNDSCDLSEDFNGNSFLAMATNIVFALFITNAIAAIIMNGSVLWALSRVKSSSLKAKVFIQNTTIANLLLPVVSCIDLPFLTGRDASLTVQICASGVYFLAFTIASFVQTLSVFGLTLDRLYAVAKPLRYGTTGYSRWQKALFVIFPWLNAVVIWGCFLVHLIQHMPPSPDEVPAVCFVVLSTFRVMWEIRMVDAFFIFFHSLSFMIYVVVFICLKWQNTSIKNISDSSVKQNTVSLAVTYFLINFTTLCLYLPTPIYSVVFQEMVADPRESDQFILTLKGLQCIYFLNSSFNPLLLMIRARLIRENLPLKCS